MTQPSQHLSEVYSSWDIQFGPTDPLNPGFGYEIKVSFNGNVVLWTSHHPISGDPLTYHGCVEVAAMYGPSRTV